MSSNGTQLIAVHAGHYVQEEKLELVIEAARKLVNDARDQTGVTIAPAMPADQTDAVHSPRILRVEERQETSDGKLTYYDDIYYLRLSIWLLVRYRRAKAGARLFSLSW